MAGIRPRRPRRTFSRARESHSFPCQAGFWRRWALRTSHPMKTKPKPIGPLVAAALATLVLAGCASTAIDQNFADAQQFSRERLGGELKWLTTDEARHQAQSDVDAMLAKPLDGDTAVRIALAYSASLQAMLYESASSSASAAQSARLPNPVFAFERLVRKDAGSRELELTRTLSFSLLDLLLLPGRLR